MSKTAGSNQVSVATSGATLVVPANAGRIWLRVTNLDGTNAVYLGGSSVSTSNGDKLAAGASVVIETAAAQAPVYAQAASAPVTVSYSEVVS